MCALYMGFVGFCLLLLQSIEQIKLHSNYWYLVILMVGLIVLICHPIMSRVLGRIHI
jgi:hypothetical protein